MKIQGLVDPKNKPFGWILPIEIQIFILYPAECFITNDKRRKVNRKIRLLPNCEITGYPQILGENLRCNQVVVRHGVRRQNHCHHCHRLLDHRLSVSELTLFPFVGCWDTWTRLIYGALYIFDRLAWWLCWLGNPSTWTSYSTKAWPCPSECL